MEIHGSLEQMREMRNLEYRETQRQYWKVSLAPATIPDFEE